MLTMTKEIVERLREGKFAGGKLVMQEAADHIEFLAAKMERLEKIIRSGVNMRAQQRAYFKNKTKDALVQAKNAENSFDSMTLEYVTGRK